MIDKTGFARWSGGLKDGKGHVSTQTGSLDDMPYTFATRFEGVSGTNPEELLGAAHAACYSMALSGVLSEYELKADKIETEAKVSLDPATGSISKIHLTLTASIPGASDEDFQAAAKKAKENCPVSKLFHADISLDATLS